MWLRLAAHMTEPCGSEMHNSRPVPVSSLSPSLPTPSLPNPSLLRAMNEWILIEQGTGGIRELYDYWIQGKTKQVQPPRWSVIRDILGWVK